MPITQQPFCDQCSENNSCAQVMDAACVQYHPDNDKPTKLPNLGVANGTSSEKIFEVIDEYIGTNTIPIKKIDTSSVSITLSGTASHTVQADVKVSQSADNLLEVFADGLYVKTPEIDVPDAPTIDAATIINLIKENTEFRALVCEIMTECMGECPGIVNITTP